MTCKRAPNRILGAAVLFIAVLTILIAFPAPAQQAGTGRPSAKTSPAAVAQAITPVEALLQPLLPGAKGQRVSAARLQGKKGASAVPDPANLVFAPVVTYSSGGFGTGSIAAADLNGDGSPDVVVANSWNCVNGMNCESYGTVGVLLGNGDGTFQPVVIYKSGGQDAVSVAVADVNGDGKPDLMVANEDCDYFGGNCQQGAIGVLLGNGDGTFQPAVAYGSGGQQASSVAVADVNGDGKPDLLVANGCSVGNCGYPFQYGLVGVLLGNGDGTFQPAVSYDSGGIGPMSIAAADVNGDGKTDLVVANCGCSGGFFDNSGPVDVLMGNGDGTFKPAVAYSSGPYPWSVVIADVNGDGHPDLLVANSCWCGQDATVAVILGNGDGTFQRAVTYDSGELTFGIAVADLNGDGKPDLIVENDCATSDCNTDSTTGVLLGNGDGTFQPVVTFDNGGRGVSSAAVADVNGDGRLDLLAANRCIPGNYCGEGSVGVLLNNTSFCTTPPVITVSTTPTALWPPNGRMMPVTVSGAITDTGCTVTSAAYAVTDEYGQVQPSGVVTLGGGGAYSFTVLLQASRLGNDLDGRHYTITVGASNNAGKTGSQTNAVIVPHDRGH